MCSSFLVSPHTEDIYPGLPDVRSSQLYTKSECKLSMPPELSSRMSPLAVKIIQEVAPDISRAQHFADLHGSAYIDEDLRSAPIHHENGQWMKNTFFDHDRDAVKSIESANTVPNFVPSSVSITGGATINRYKAAAIFTTLPSHPSLATLTTRKNAMNIGDASEELVVDSDCSNLGKRKRGESESIFLDSSDDGVLATSSNLANDHECDVWGDDEWKN